MPFDLFVAILFLIFWIGLAIALAFGYRWMRDHERDTRLSQEVGLDPKLEVFGAGRINRRQWSRGRGCRVSVYDDFLVVSVSSQRISIPLYSVREVHLTPDDRQLTLKGFTVDETLLSMDFRGPDAARLAAHLRQHGRGIRTPHNV